MEKVNVQLDELLKMPMEVLQRHTKMLKWEGVFFILLGVVAIVMPLFFSVAIEVFLGSLLIIGGFAGLTRSFNGKKIPGAIFSMLTYLIFIAAGILLIVRPLIGVMTLAAILGVFFLFSGLGKIAFAFNIKPAKNWKWSLFDGILCIVLGGIIFAEWPSSGPLIIGIIVGIRLLFLGNAMIMISNGLQKSAES